MWNNMEWKFSWISKRDFKLEIIKIRVILDFYLSSHRVHWILILFSRITDRIYSIMLLLIGINAKFSSTGNILFVHYSKKYIITPSRSDVNGEKMYTLFDDCYERQERWLGIGEKEERRGKILEGLQWPERGKEEESSSATWNFSIRSREEDWIGIFWTIANSYVV